MNDICYEKNILVNCSSREDSFVGIKCENEQIRVLFPMGYRLINNPKQIRKDILLLIKILSREKKIESVQGNKMQCYEKKSVPIQAYAAIIKDYLDRGYYIEREIAYKTSLMGKIDWRRTIGKQKICVQDNEFYYLNFTTKKNRINENEIVTLIHEFCVYESFKKLGFLFSTYIPEKPRISLQRTMFLSVLNDKVVETNNDRNRQLFKDMVALIENLDTNGDDYWYGTYRFEYVWQDIIDDIFGIINKQKYFPKTYWKMKGENYSNHTLEPDTIMIYNNIIYVLDAKYYKYGITYNIGDLPGTSSIEKQITYGEYIAKNRTVDNLGDNVQVYNAFIMPYMGSDDEIVKNIGYGFSDWKYGENQYENIQGILIDTRWLLENYYSKGEYASRLLVESISQIDR